MEIWKHGKNIIQKLNHKIEKYFVTVDADFK